MSKSANDRNLLVGILALQLDLITQPQLIAAMQAWMLAKSNSLEVLLENQKAITQDERAFLAALVDKHLSLHNNNVEESLAALSSIDSVRKGLTALDDSDLDQTLSMVSALKGRRAWQENDDPDATTLNTGSALSGERFRILRPHARGGLGQVSVAEDRELNREVALKEIQGRYADDAESRVRFKVEAEVTGQLEHPGIVPVYSLGQTEDGRPFYVMRFIKGDSLKEAIRQLYSESFQKAPAEDRRMMLRKLLRRLVDVCNAIEYAHSRGILHRDLTPGNIMLGKYGETLVVDWGLAKHIGRTEKHEGNDEKSVVPLSGDGSSATRLGSVVGTLAFMSPEQAEGRVDELGPPSDVYCLGTTLYSILTGHNPIRRSSEFEMLQTISRGDIVPVSRANSEIDPALAAICTKAMALKQVNRYPTAAALGDDLERWLADEPVFAYKEPLLRRAGRFVRRHKTASVTALSLIAASLVAMIVISAIVTSKNRALAAANAQILNEQQLLKSTRDSFRGLAFEVLDAAEKELSNKPGMEQFRDGVMERSFDTLVQLRQDSPGDRRVALELARSARLSGNQKARTNDSPEAERRLQLSISLQEELLPTAENADDSRLYLIETFRDLAGVKRRLGKLSEAAAALETGGGLLSELTSGNNQDSNFVRAAAENSLAWIGVHYELLQQEQALESARLADEGHYAVLSAGIVV